MADPRNSHIKAVEKLAAALRKWLGRTPGVPAGHNSGRETGQTSGCARRAPPGQNKRAIDQVNAIRVKAELARRHAQAARLGLDMQNLAAEVRVRAERAIAAKLVAAGLRGGDRQSAAHGQRSTLAELGIDRNQSSRWQREAAVPEKVFEAYLASAKRRGEPITSEDLLRLEEMNGRDFVNGG